MFMMSKSLLFDNLSSTVAYRSFTASFSNLNNLRKNHLNPINFRNERRCTKRQELLFRFSAETFLVAKTVKHVLL